MSKSVVKSMVSFVLLVLLCISLIVPANAMNHKFVHGTEELETQISSMDTAMQTAHFIAECARAIPMESSEVDFIIGVAKNHYFMANELKAQYVNELSELSDVTFTYDPYIISNLSEYAFDRLLEDTEMENLGKSFVDLEQEYGVNALFAMAVARTESGLGTSSMAKRQHNFFGMIGNSYNSDYEGIMGFGKLMQKDWYYQKDIERIAKTYCPPTASHWAAQNKDFMEEFWNELIAMEEMETLMEDTEKQLDKPSIFTNTLDK